MASTYPLEIVEAYRWQQKNSSLKGKALEEALQKQDWDPAVKSICGLPSVLKQMNDSLDWTQDLGDAFLGQKEDLMKTVQAMRKKALEAGNLKSSEQQKVSQQGDIVIIESTKTEVVYVPTYYPTAVYGAWSYPYYYYPPMYPPYPTGGLMFGFAVGVAWGGCWSNCNWGGNDIDIDINNQNNFIDRTENTNRRQEVKDRRGRARTAPGTRPGQGHLSARSGAPQGRQLQEPADGAEVRRHGSFESGLEGPGARLRPLGIRRAGPAQLDRGRRQGRDRRREARRVRRQAMRVRARTQLRGPAAAEAVP
jgi:hypothetical protein